MNVSAVFGSSAAVAALRAHDFADSAVTLAFDDVKPVHRAFPAMVNDQRYDLAELAIVTFLQAMDAGRPLCLLPVTLLGRFQHHCLVTMDGPGAAGVAGLAGKRVGVRSWSQTTGVWVRGIMSDDHGLDVSQVEWVVYEGAHVAGTVEPSYVVRAPDGATLPGDFLGGALDAGIMGNDLPGDPRIRTVLSRPARDAAGWYARTGAIPLNHMVAATDSFVTANPGLVRELCGVLAGAVPATPRISSSPDFYPSGFDAVAPSLDLIGRYAFEQGVTSRVITAAEIRAKTERLSGLELGRLNAGGS